MPSFPSGSISTYSAFVAAPSQFDTFALVIESSVLLLL